MILTYKIINFYFDIYGNNKYIPNLDKFVVMNKGEIAILCEKNTKAGVYQNLEIYSGLKEQDTIIRRDEDIMIVNKDWTYNRICSLRNQANFMAFWLQIFYTHAVKGRVLQIHASLVGIKKTGILFLGPSGIGKTTQAELWSKYRDALIINGDIVFVQETPDAFLGWGTPWHGSSPYCENTSVPVAAMVVLKQAPKNSIRELTGFEKVTEVSNSVFYPQWVEGGMELCLETLDHLLTKIPVYELSCRPDEGAVELVEQVVFGHVQ